jgi:activator of HSP90 ATPase
MPRTIRQIITFKATPHQVYEALMDSRQHARFTGAAASISRRAGGEFTAYDGALHGRNLELVADTKIVQDWHCQEDDWPPDQYSRLTITLREVPKGTQLRMTHRGVPEAHVDGIKSGWHTEYWDKMKATFGW